MSLKTLSGKSSLIFSKMNWLELGKTCTLKREHNPSGEQELRFRRWLVLSRVPGDYFETLSHVVIKSNENIVDLDVDASSVDLLEDAAPAI